MIDTIRIYSEDIGTLESFDRDRLSDLKETSKNDYIYYTGYLDTLYVTYSTRTITIMGSLSKFYFGNNVEVLSRIQIIDSIKKLEEKLNLDLNNFRISRIDIGVTFKMDNSVQSYLDSLIEIPRYQLVTFENESKSFQNKSKSLVIYDKVAEMNRKKPTREILTELGLSNSYLLRYELQFKKARTTLYKPKVADLYDDRFIKLLLRIWKDDFHKIKKQNKLLNFEEVQFKKPNDFLNYLICEHIDEKGKQQSLNLLYRCHNAKMINRSSFYDIQRRIKGSEKKFCETSKYIEELEVKINNFAEGYISDS